MCTLSNMLHESYPNGYQCPSNHKVERDTVKDCILLINNERYKANKHISSMWWGQH